MIYAIIQIYNAKISWYAFILKFKMPLGKLDFEH